jgi:hypothetical protein
MWLLGLLVVDLGAGLRLGERSSLFELWWVNLLLLNPLLGELFAQRA